MEYKRTLLIGILLCFLNSVRAQNMLRYIDSLEAQLAVEVNDSQRIRLLSKYSRAVDESKPEESAKSAAEAVRLSFALRWPEGMASSLTALGRYEWRQGDFERAKMHHRQALWLWEKMERQDQVANLMIYLGQDYADAGEYPEALPWVLRADSMLEVLGDYDGRSLAMSVISWLYQNMGMLPESHETQLTFLRLAEQMQDSTAIAIALSNLADNDFNEGRYAEALERFQNGVRILQRAGHFFNAASDMLRVANCYFALGRTEEGFAWLQKSQNLSDSIQDGDLVGRVHLKWAEQLFDMQRYQEALDHADRSLKGFQQTNNQPSLVQLYSLMGRCHTRLGHYREAARAFDRAWESVQALNSTFERSVYFRARVPFDSATGRFEDAFRHHKRLALISDSLYNEENTRKIVRSSLQYEFEKKEAEARAEREKRAQRQRLIRNSIGAGLAISLLFLIIVWGQRNRIQREKKRSEELLLNILPLEVAEELKSHGSAEARMFDEVTVLFTDFKGFTAYSEQLSPKALVADLHHCFSVFDQIAEDHRLEKIKTIGDAYMAAGGLPVPNVTNATDVVRAALEIRDFIEKGKAEKQRRNEPWFEIRVGVHTGPVVAGIVGVKKFSYDIWGDTVNTAARMESSGEAGKVNISQSTFERIRALPEFRCTSRGAIEAKGKGELEMWFVERGDLIKS